MWRRMGSIAGIRRHAAHLARAMPIGYPPTGMAGPVSPLGRMIGTTVLLLAIAAYARFPDALKATSDGDGPTTTFCRTLPVAASRSTTRRSFCRVTATVDPSGLVVSLNGPDPTVIAAPAVRVAVSIGV